MTLTAKLILILFGLAYLISPVDIIPDLALPFLGWIDDGLVLWCIYYLIRYGDLPWFMFKRPRNPGTFSRTGPAPWTKSDRGSRSRRHRSGKEAGNGPQKKNQTDAEPGAGSRSGPQADSGSGRKSDSGPDKGQDKGTENAASPYEILGVEKTATWKEIQKAYKEKIKQYHPDKLSHLGEEFSSLANEKFLEIQAAYDQLRVMRGRS